MPFLPQAVRHAFPPIVIVGGSMEPTLGRGARVRVGPLTGAPVAGDVVLIRGAQELIVHRVVYFARFLSGARVFHRGDAGGGIGLSLEEAVLGRVTGVLDPPAPGLPQLSGTAPAVQRRVWSAFRRCRAYALLRQLAERLGLADLPVLRRAAALARWLWL
jgi:hypothetical protein